MTLPAPNRLGLPAHFSGWRTNQPESVLALIDSASRISALVAPTGSGKSLTYAAFAKLYKPEGRTVILTSTKSLQSQLMSDFGRTGMIDVRGQNNYLCRLVPELRVDEGPCHLGETCEYKLGGCSYYDQVRRAQQAKLVVTNYSFWLSQAEYGQGLGEVDLLIMDESHSAPDELAEFLSVQVSEKDCSSLLHCGPPPLSDWVSWAKIARRSAEAELEELKTARKSAGWKLRKLRQLQTSLSRLCIAKPDEWVMEPTTNQAGNQSWRFDPIWPGPYAEHLLFQEIPRVVLVSATIRPKTMHLLGLSSDKYDWSEWPSLWPSSNRPVTYIPTIRLNHHTDPSSLKLWLSRIDQIIDRRLDRKGIIHTVSYGRRDYIVQNSRHRHLMLTHQSAREQGLAVDTFRKAKAPCVLVSPSVTTGLDFPADDCRYQVIAKVPFPDSRSKILQARQKADPEYAMYLAMIEVVQASGRGVRSKTDWCETLIIDDQWSWFAKKYRRFAPDWFWQSTRRVETVPDPPKPGEAR